MKTKSLSAVLALASLIAAGSSAVAATPHDGYYGAFYGTTTANSVESAGSAAFGTPAQGAWSGHEAYDRAFGQPSITLAPDTMGKAAYGSSQPGPDGNAIYHAAFHAE